MYEQLELFSIDEMYGCIGVKDEKTAVYVAIYLWAIKFVSELDDEQFRKVKKGLDTVQIEEDEYFVPFVPGSMNIFKFIALRDCLIMREEVHLGERYIHHYPEVNIRPHVTDPYSFVMARKAFQENFNKEYTESGWWITDLDIHQLLYPNLWEHV